MRVTFDDIRAARERASGLARRTPLLPSSALSAATGAHVSLKCENLQRTGSFKIRGAANRIAALSPEERARGVIAASAGNHAQGVAVAAREHAVRATIVMPHTTPLAKVEATRGYGADVLLHGDSYEDARHECERRAGEHGAMIIPAFDDPLIIAGQGTVGIEIAEELAGVSLVVVPVGGGGLAAGVAIAVKALVPAARVIGVQVEAAPGAARSRAAGRVLDIAPGPTIAEGIAVAGPSALTHELLQRYVDDIVLVDEDDVAEAMVLLLERSKLVVEGAGAASVAALMSARVRARGERVCAVLSGGNADINMIARVVEHGLTTAGRYYSLTVGLDDKPGQLAQLSEIFAEAGANILSVSHQRFGIALPVGRVHVALLLEVRNREHAAVVQKALAAHGFRRGAAGEPEYVPTAWERE